MWALNGVCRASEQVFRRGLRAVGGAEMTEEGITG